MHNESKRRFHANSRGEVLNTLAGQQLDILIIGGGITGAGIALDAAARGLKVGLIEMQDFAGGTSSRSTKLIHGGLRYLKQLEIGVVAEVGKERAIVYENGPHITTPEKMLLPIYKGGTFGKWSTSIGLRLYDFLAGVKKNERRKMLSVKETLEKEPLLKREGLLGGGYYVEYRTDDARLTIEVMKKAHELGAQLVNYTKAQQLIYGDDGKLIGVAVQDSITGQEYSLYAKTVVNATGPWVDEIRQLDKSKEGKTLRLTKGVHLVFDQKSFPLQQAVYYDTADGRMVFAIPRDGKTYFGTTDTNYSGDIAHPVTTSEDRSYLLAAVGNCFPSLKLTEKHIESSWAGLRPLIQQPGKSPSEISRRDEIFVSPSGLISIAGGKLTGYRKMAEHVVNKALTVLGISNENESVTKHLKLSGGDVGGSSQYEAFIASKLKQGIAIGLSKEAAERMIRRYGSNISTIYDMADEAVVWGNKFGLNTEMALMLKYALEYEMTVSPSDFFIRRTGTLLFQVDAVLSWKEAVIQAMAEEFNWDSEQKDYYTTELEEQLVIARKAN